MDMDDDLTGMLVLVHPELADDPVSRQGQVGMLLYADKEKDDMYVTFGKGAQALYSSNALLVLKKPGDIYRDLMAHSKDLPVADFKTLFQVSNLLDQGSSLKAKEAMQLIAENPSAIPRAMIGLDEKLGMVIDQRREQEPEIASSRGR